MSNITKLGLGIVAFEGTEHIKNITYEIRDQVDEIIVCLQRMSYHNEPISQYDVDEVDKLVRVGLVDKVVWFEPDLSYMNNPSINKGDAPRLVETDKRNFILQTLQDDGCSHSMVIDSDEFYDKYEFARAKNYINENEDVHVTYCRYFNYWQDYEHYLVWPFESYVPFITESKYRFEFRAHCFSKPIDPTRIYKVEEGGKYEMFSWNSIKMHHLSWLRLDIKKKIYSWSSKNYFDKSLPDRSYERYKNWKEYECALLMFGVPNNKVVIEKLDKQYIHPHYKIYESVE